VKVSAWGDAVREVLGCSPVREAHIAGALKIDRALLHQYLSGRRRPKPDIVRRIDAAVAKLIGTDDASRCLDADARECGLLDASDAERLRDGLALFELVVGKLTPDLAHRFDDVVGALPEAVRTTLLGTLRRAHRKMLCYSIKKQLRHKAALEQLQGAFAQAGIELDALLGADEHGTPEQVRLNSALRGAIAQTFATFFPTASPTEWFGAHRAIERAVTDYMDAHPGFTMVRRQGPSLLYELSRPKQTSKPTAAVDSPMVPGEHPRQRRARHKKGNQK
jgi:hypothetical protein